MIEPALKGDRFLEQVAGEEPGAGFTLWWLGQSGFLIKTAAGCVLLDPYLSDSLTDKYAATDKPHVRMTERIVDPLRLGFVGAVASTHLHTDHLDGGTLRPLLAANPELEIVVPRAHLEAAAERIGVKPDRLRTIDAGEELALDRVPGLALHAVPAAHERRERDDNGRERYLGYVLHSPAWSIYHSGDTVLYDGMVELLRPFAVDVALLPINGRRPERRVAGNLWGREAARLAHEIGARLVVPCHYEMFTFNTESPDELLRTCAEIGQPCRVRRCGERLRSRELGNALDISADLSS